MHDMVREKRPVLFNTLFRLMLNVSIIFGMLFE